MSLPDGFIAKMTALLGPESEAFLASLAGAARAGLRVNTLKSTPEAFVTRSPWPLAPLPWCSSGFLLPENARPGLHSLHRAGVFYLQEPSAMAVAEALAPRPGEWVIDLAAAPGGKTTHLVSLLQNQGLLVANEVDPKRVRSLGENLERWGAKNTLITSDSVANLAQRWGAVFDRVLLDAPCSGEGMFRKSEEALAQWSAGLVESCAARQDELLEGASELVKPGGVLVYSTCTFAPEENEQVVESFLRTRPDFALEPLTLPGAAAGRTDWLSEPVPGLEKTARFWPHRVAGEGHFVARFRRTGGEEARATPATPTPLPRPARALWETFVGDTLAADPVVGAQLLLKRDNLYALSQAPLDLTGIRTLRPGLWLGTLKKNRFEPSHSLALALTPTELEGIKTLELPEGSPELTRYLQGDVLEAAGDSGWLVVTVSGFALGWGRRSQGVVKNFYPKGLRLPSR